jgi:hypothetical protein
MFYAVLPLKSKQVQLLRWRRLTPLHRVCLRGHSECAATQDMKAIGMFSPQHNPLLCFCSARSDFIEILFCF